MRSAHAALGLFVRPSPLFIRPGSTFEYGRFACAELPDDAVGIFARDGQLLAADRKPRARGARDMGPAHDIGPVDAQKPQLVQDRLPLRDGRPRAELFAVHRVDDDLRIVRGDVEDPVLGQRDAAALRDEVDPLRLCRLAAGEPAVQ